ncbi:hypothetical protein V4V35_23815 [Bacillus infantis]|uniref:hypothetical protein n=1 Tax=Bacillus infantis TaxID=324767 RepID=UPI002FBED7A6
MSYYTMKEKWELGRVKVGSRDKAGNELRQFDFVVMEDPDEGEHSLHCIIYSETTQSFVAMHDSGGFIMQEDFSLALKVEDILAERLLGWSKIEVDGEMYWDMGGLLDGIPDKTILYREFDPMNDRKWMETVLYSIYEAHPLEWVESEFSSTVYYVTDPESGEEAETFSLAAIQMLLKIAGYELI